MIDLVIILVYLAGCIAAGVAFSGRQKGAADYFSASGGMKGWFNSVLVGLSVAATLFSGISFVMLPAVFFSGGTALVFVLVSFPVGWVVLRYFFLPRYLSGPAGQQPYDVIERRFGPAVRTSAATLYLLFRVCWMAALVYAPTVAVLGAWQLDDAWFWPLVLTIGLSSTCYTMIGGLRGVIFTDAIQMLVIATGIAFVIGFIVWRLPVPVGEGLSRATSDGLFATMNFSWSLQTMTIWAVLAGGVVNNLGNYIGDQMSLQRYLASGDARESTRAFLVNVVSAAVVVVLWGVVGVALRIWYTTVPDSGLPGNQDEVLPYFIATQLPPGITGLIIAAVLAATMSSMTSGINTLAGVITLDFWGRFGGKTDALSSRQQLRRGRWVSLAVGVAATLSVGLIEGLGTIFDIGQTLLGALGGPLFACVLLAVTRLRLAPTAVLIGFVLGPVAGWIVAYSPVISLWIGPISFAVSMTASLALSPLFKAFPGVETPERPTPGDAQRDAITPPQESMT